MSAGSIGGVVNVADIAKGSEIAGGYNGQECSNKAWLDMRHKLSEHFYFDELFSKYMCQNYSTAQLQRMLHPRLMDAVEAIREAFGSGIYINNWYNGGDRQFSGFREPDTINPLNRWYSITSAHSRCCAVDMISADGRSANEMRDMIMYYENWFYKAGVRRLESGQDAPTWVHMDLIEDAGYQGIIKVFRA